MNPVDQMFDDYAKRTASAIRAATLIGFAIGFITGGFVVYAWLSGKTADAAPLVTGKSIFVTESKETLVIADGNGDGQDDIVHIVHGRYIVRDAGTLAKLNVGKRQEIKTVGDTVVSVKP
jgi:hypothetical protein